MWRKQFRMISGLLNTSRLPFRGISTRHKISKKIREKLLGIGKKVEEYRVA
jgi:hypothetical protein